LNTEFKELLKMPQKNRKNAAVNKMWIAQKHDSRAYRNQKPTPIINREEEEQAIAKFIAKRKGKIKVLSPDTRGTTIPIEQFGERVLRVTPNWRG
jgi:hypothetical protein